MGILDTLVPVTITASGATPQVANYGTPAIICYHTLNSDYIRTYTDVEGYLDEPGAAATDPAYYMLSTIFSQEPSPSSAKLIRGTSAVTQSCAFVVTNTTVAPLYEAQLRQVLLHLVDMGDHEHGALAFGAELDAGIAGSGGFEGGSHSGLSFSFRPLRCGRGRCRR